jgi:hypothetical protein
MWHYESDRPLSAAQLIAAGSLDTWTAALIWTLIERHQSLIVSGPTDPTPGVGKTTTLNALLGFLPGGSTVVYTMGMFEDFEFTKDVEAATTCVLANEVSDHLRIYMWGHSARALLALPADGFAVATSCHADTIDDVMTMLTSDLRVPSADLRRLGVIVNIGLVGGDWPPLRRFLSVHFIFPDGGEDERWGVSLQRLAEWQDGDDSFAHADAATLAALAAALGMDAAELEMSIARRMAALEPLSAGRGASIHAMRRTVEAVIAAERGESSGATEANTETALEPDAVTEDEG